MDAVFDSVSIATTFKEELSKAGVVFCSISEAVREMPDLVRKHLGSVVRAKTLICIDEPLFRLFQESGGSPCYDCCRAHALASVQGSCYLNQEPLEQTLSLAILPGCTSGWRHASSSHCHGRYCRGYFSLSLRVYIRCQLLTSSDL